MWRAVLGVVLALPSAARGDAGAIVVVGGAPDHTRAVIAAAVEDTVRRAGWAIAGAPSDVGVVVACLAAERPWPCLAPAVTASGARQVLVVQADVERGQLVLTGQLVVAGDGVPAIDRRYGPARDDDAAARTAEALARQLLRDTAGRPGPVDVRDPAGYRGAVEARGTAGRSRRVLPIVLIAAGALAVAGGAYASATADPPAGGPQPHYRYDALAIGVAIAGAGAIGAGIAWWRRARSAPVLAVGVSGVVAGWSMEL